MHELVVPRSIPIILPFPAITFIPEEAANVFAARDYGTRCRPYAVLDSLWVPKTDIPKCHPLVSASNVDLLSVLMAILNRMACKLLPSRF